MPTIGLFRCWPPMEPKKPASPKLKMPPSDATSQYPLVLGVTPMPTTGWLRRMLPVLPQKLASPKSNTPPSLAAKR